MKVCPQCNRRFPDNASTCPHDGTPLRSAKPKPSAPENTDLTGRVFFGEYTITKKLGEGGMGAVYLATQKSIDQHIALKVLHARAAESDEIVKRFHREAKVISMLTHPNIVRVFIFGRTEEDLLYLAMEFVEGRELRRKLDGGPLEELAAIKILKQMCSALAEAHDLGIIHRDLKPDNVLLTNFRGEQNFVKILDFGIAKLQQPEGKQEQKLTQAGIVYGTPEYLSPEQAQALDLDQRTDIYSLGCILYELLTGRVPFHAESPVQILTKHVFEEPKPPSQVAPGRIAPTMERIILKAMAKKPEERFQTSLEMFDALVAREREILSERRLDSRATYFPGSELTGLHNADELKRALEANQQDDDTQASFETASTMAMQAPAHHSAPAPAAPAAQNPQHPTQPQPTGGQPAQDSSRKIIIAAIGVLIFILLVLAGVITALLVTK